jgi:hypothetical protein
MDKRFSILVGTLLVLMGGVALAFTLVLPMLGWDTWRWGIISIIRGNDLTRCQSRSSNGQPHFSWQAALDIGTILAYAQG